VTVLNAGDLGGVLFGKNLTVCDGLDGCVVMVLVDFAVDSLGLLVELAASYVLLLDGWVDGLVDSGVMLSILGEEVSNSCLCLVHCDRSCACVFGVLLGMERSLVMQDGYES